tara:strand:- start:8279 stop:9268 length:990 start_codon:yes stop_codon:yes gene_type:complete
MFTFLFSFFLSFALADDVDTNPLSELKNELLETTKSVEQLKELLGIPKGHFIQIHTGEYPHLMEEFRLYSRIYEKTPDYVLEAEESVFRKVRLLGNPEIKITSQDVLAFLKETKSVIAEQTKQINEREFIDLATLEFDHLARSFSRKFATEIYQHGRISDSSIDKMSQQLDHSIANLYPKDINQLFMKKYLEIADRYESQHRIQGSEFLFQLFHSMAEFSVYRNGTDFNRQKYNSIFFAVINTVLAEPDMYFSNRADLKSFLSASLKAVELHYQVYQQISQEKDSRRESLSKAEMQKAAKLHDALEAFLLKTFPHLNTRMSNRTCRRLF